MYVNRVYPCLVGGMVSLVWNILSHPHLLTLCIPLDFTYAKCSVVLVSMAPDLALFAILFIFFNVTIVQAV